MFEEYMVLPVESVKYLFDEFAPGSDLGPAEYNRLEEVLSEACNDEEAFEIADIQRLLDYASESHSTDPEKQEKVQEHIDILNDLLE